MSFFITILRTSGLMLLCIMSFTRMAYADAATHIGNASLFAARDNALSSNAKPLIQASTGPVSMFGTQKALGFFAPLPPKDSLQDRAAYRSYATTNIDRLRAIIGRAESHQHGYDAVQHAAKVKPHKAPTQMTLGEIFAWIDATPGQQHAIGRYQFIPKTLKRLVGILGAQQNERFSPELQNALSDILLLEAGYNDIQSGRMSRHAFMNNLAKIWAGLPTTSGKSHYHGYAGNRASITWTEFDAEMQKIFPQAVRS